MPTNTTDPHAIAGMITRLHDRDYSRWAAQIHRTRGCRQPINLRGHVDHLDPATGAVLHRYSTAREPGGILRVACKTRRASRCPACAETYRADTYHLIRAGLVGGKGVAETVSGHPCLFLTLTAPSFGTVHTRCGRGGRVLPCHARRDATVCAHGRPASCTARHAADDPRLGEPLCADCYDYTATVLFNAMASQLWRRFTDALRRRVAKLAGLPLCHLPEHVRVSFAKVAEYQRRGVVHFQAIIRLDGPDGPNTAPPAWATADLLAAAIRHAVGAVSVTVPGGAGEPERVLRWGTQVDVRPITSDGEVTEQAVAGYVAKYATKAAECVGALDRRVNLLDDLTALPIRDHARELIAECLRLGILEHLADLRLIQWAHMLGFRGHFSTRSRRYSTTLGALRAERTDHARSDAVTTGRLPLFDEDTILVIGHWRYAGSPGDALLAGALTGTRMPQMATGEGTAA